MRRRLLYLCLALCAASTLGVCITVLAGLKETAARERSNAMLRSALRLHRRGETQQALALAREAVAEAPRNPRAHQAVGVFLTAERQLGEAVVELRAAAALPDDAGVASDLAEALAAQGDRAEATRWLRRATELRPSDASSRVRLARLLLESEDARDALSVAQEAAALAPRSPDAQFMLGLARWGSRDAHGAYAAFHEAVRLRPSFVAALASLASAAQALGRPGEAVEYLRRASALRPEDTRVWMTLGSALLESGDRKGAGEAFQRALRLDPGSDAARRGLAAAGAQESH
jgi:Flp pilus assembly protein TadD